MTSDDSPEPVAIDITSKMGVIDEQECIELIESTPIGRVAFVADDEILALPVNFKWHDGGVVFRTLDGHKLAAAADQQKVCFEVDRWDEQSHSGWSVIVQGQAREVTNWAEEAQLDQIGLVPWAKAEWRPIWVRIEAEHISGRVLR